MPHIRLLRALAVLAVSALLLSGAACSARPTAIAGHPKVRIEMKDGTSMTLELYPEYAPETVANFLSLVDDGFYDGLTFHRIVKGFMIQGGDPKGDGTGGSGKTIKGEFSLNGFKQNTLLHTFGVISMARGSGYNTADSQFFLMVGTSTYLDGKYAAFGKLVDGASTLSALAVKAVVYNAAMDETSKPVEPVVIARIVRVSDATPTPAG